MTTKNPPHVVVSCTTLCAFAMDDEDTWGAWLYGAEESRRVCEENGIALHFFAAVEVDARGIELFSPLVDRLRELGGGYWTFMLDDGRTEVTTANRLRHITTGQNLASDYCTSPSIDYMLFMAADCQPAAAAVPKLIELDHPIVGGHVSTYGLHGPTVMHTVDMHKPAEPRYPDEWDVQEHMATAAFMLIHREVYTRLRWRWDAVAGMSDDPAYHHDAKTLLGLDTYVRHDVVGRHYPMTIGAVETRGHDMTVVRAAESPAG